MHIGPLPHLVCPHDGAPLSLRANSYVCPHGHSFDRAREGYVNLLPVQDKASRDPGDSREMVASRQRFLATGAFAPVAAALAETVIGQIAQHTAERPFALLDAGRGEGTYLAALADALADHATPSAVQLAGIDISKWAVRAAAKRAVPATWAVASNRRPPFPARSIDAILCVFGFALWSGFAAVQPQGGHVVLVDPGPDHLLELRQIIYPEVLRRETRHPIDAPGYTQVGDHRVHANAHLSAQTAIADLLSMTPHAHRATAAGQATLAARATLDITIDVEVRVLQRRDG